MVGEVEGVVGDEGEDKTDEATEEVDNGGRKPIKMLDPRLPTEAEVDEHNLTHLPFRNWCPHCVRGRGKEWPNKKVDEVSSMPEIHADICF